LGLGSHEPTPNSIGEEGEGDKPVPRGVGFFAKGFMAASVRSPPGEVDGGGGAWEKKAGKAA
jgi:hypothetical protein